MAEGLELWGGLECTIVRIGDSYRNQFEATGHLKRLGDLDLVASLGIRTLRYPVLWEMVCPSSPQNFNWSFFDGRLARLRALGIKPIVGLIHHGSGPRYTDLLDPHFPSLLAEYAKAVAERYDWIGTFAPVNEPLTTARFSGLYGHWYPHARDQKSFLLALHHECRGVLLSMRAIRDVRPDAQLVQTEDLGRIFSCPSLAYQARYENERRWLSFDLLAGRVTREHAFWAPLVKAGVPESELQDYLQGDGMPDIFGINHYATSDRYLDDAINRYPSCFYGGNERHAYADVEAIRVDHAAAEQLGVAARVRETWARYGKPIAITEAHHGSTRDEQVRWLAQEWQAARDVRSEGVDLRALTVWSLFGAVDWNSLLVRQEGFYEPGAFDIRGTAPRLTAVGKLAKAVARGETFDHPLAAQPGWWSRDIRFYHPVACKGPKGARQRPLLITGGTGTLGRALSRVCAFRGIDQVTLSRADVDLTDPRAVDNVIQELQPWGLVNAAGFVRTREADQLRDECFRSNVTVAETLAEVCERHTLGFATFSSDLVFDGSLGRAYREADETRPLCTYGESKAEAERRVALANPDALIIRTSAFFGPWDAANFVWQVLQSISNGHSPTCVGDVVSPTYVPDLANVVLDLLIDGAAGIWHVSNDGMVSWGDLAERVADRAGLRWRPEQVPTGPSRMTALTSERGALLPSLDHAIDRYFHECEVPWASA